MTTALALMLGFASMCLVGFVWLLCLAARLGDKHDEQRRNDWRDHV